MAHLQPQIQKACATLQWGGTKAMAIRCRFRVWGLRLDPDYAVTLVTLRIHRVFMGNMWCITTRIQVFGFVAGLS